MALSKAAVISTASTLVITILLGITVRAETMHVHVSRSTAKVIAHIKIDATGSTWFGKPIFAMTNESAFTIKHVALKSWSNHLLPILAIGKKRPQGWPKNNVALLAPPFNLSSHQTLWFVGPTSKEVKFNLYWTEDGDPVYQVVTGQK